MKPDLDLALGYRICTHYPSALEVRTQVKNSDYGVHTHYNIQSNLAQTEVALANRPTALTINFRLRFLSPAKCKFKT